MVSSSSSWHSTYDVFPSFSGEDVRRTFLSHVHEEFERRGIFTFKDNGIARSRSIGPELERAIRESRIAIVVLSRNYASSGWCLNELLQIMKQRRTSEQTVMTVFYQLDPYDVRKHTGKFGRAFMKTHVGKSSEEKQRWKHALTEVSNIAGEHSEKWYVMSFLSDFHSFISSPSHFHVSWFRV
ncbi:PREDICTED: probable disease resistance protein RPP1 [Tarenaya hassleriana]|uniref:probable disease resistance protein RPP1 n=1 Tax=Tarenaya hassleriana TaxID=28532 RepID=UPI00053C6DFC|nr:PREDICTED: probable disease resistance protein RPP1 [Tarenaya hassleriana]